MKIGEGKKVVVAMSGGVDSSVAAAILQLQGYDIIGMSVQTFDASKDEKERFDSCCSISDMDDARRVCASLDVPHFVVNAVDEFDAFVIDNFVSEYLNGRTPNPCVLCNNYIKFDFLLKKAKELGANYVATGHYAKIYHDKEENRFGILQAADEHKDQSYYLFGLTQEQLSHTIMPLGDLRKIQVRKMAEEFGLLRVSKKPDSQEICFVGSAGYAKFIEQRVAPDLIKKNVDFILPDGSVLNAPGGVHRFTIGQRKGIPNSVYRMATKINLDPSDLYVSKIDSDKNTVSLGYEKALLHTKFIVDKFNWMVADDCFLGKDVLVRVRSQQKPTQARVQNYAGNQVCIEFQEPQRAITPGQAAVIYNGDRVLGGGWIRGVVHEEDYANP